jgi:hypothetical protein
MWGVLSDKRTCLSLTVAADPRQRSHSRVRVTPDSGLYTILLSQIRDSANLESRVHVSVPPGTGFPLRRLLRLTGLRWTYSNPPPHGMLTQRFLVPGTKGYHGPCRKYRFQELLYYCVFIHCRGNMFTAPLLSSGPIL